MTDMSTLAWTMSFLVSIPGAAHRLFTVARPRTPAKSPSAIRIGLLGASKIAPIALINPAKSHPDVVVAAVAARDKARAAAYAKTWSIPVVHESYQALLEDRSIDAVYIPVPNGLHFEWAFKALKAGKHVLLEKPSVSNAEEAAMLFQSPLLQSPNAPVLLEAFHYRFHPAFALIKALIDDLIAKGSKIKRVMSDARAPAGLFSLDDIRFKYALSGGTLMDLGTYPTSQVRHLIGKEPLRCTKAEHTPLPGAHAATEPKIDYSIQAEFDFPDDIKASIDAQLATPWLSWWRLFSTKVWLEEDTVGGPKIERSIELWNPMAPWLWHRIDVQETIRDEQTGKTKVVKKQFKAYSWSEARQQVPELTVAHADAAGETWWTTYRHQLEEFVNKIKGKTGSGIWISHEDSIKQMQMIDMVYQQSGLEVRPTSQYKP